jgi:hypothetical protein
MPHTEPNDGWEDTQEDDRDEQQDAGWNDSDDIDDQDLEKDS